MVVFYPFYEKNLGVGWLRWPLGARGRGARAFCFEIESSWAMLWTVDGIPAQFAAIMFVYTSNLCIPLPSTLWPGVGRAARVESGTHVRVTCVSRAFCFVKTPYPVFPRFRSVCPVPPSVDQNSPYYHSFFTLSCYNHPRQITHICMVGHVLVSLARPRVMATRAGACTHALVPLLPTRSPSAV